MGHPHMQFIVGLGLVGPLIAMAGVSIGGSWAGAGVGLGGLIVAIAAGRSARHTWRDRDLYPFFRRRMMAVTGIVTAAATGLTVGTAVWLVRRLSG